MATHTMTTDQLYDWLAMVRDIDTPCEGCRGTGVQTYGSTATWRGGVGGQMLTTAVCNRCWGTGDENRRGTSFREIERWKAAFDREQAKKE